VLHIRTGDSTFTVVETNQFKHLSHLSLVFRQGNDSVIKQFLAGRLAEYKASGEKKQLSLFYFILFFV
jgi:spindle assembly abnormal protein 6